MSKFYYYLSRKDLQLSPSAISSNLSLAKSFEVILSERKTPTLVHKPCQALYKCPYVKLIPISKLTRQTTTYIHLPHPPELYEACRGRNQLSGRQIVNKSFAFICGKIWIKTVAKGNPICSLETLHQGNSRQHSSCKDDIDRFEIPLFPLLDIGPLRLLEISLPGTKDSGGGGILL